MVLGVPLEHEWLVPKLSLGTSSGMQNNRPRLFQEKAWCVGRTLHIDGLRQSFFFAAS
jgi:hypothetical protein